MKTYVVGGAVRDAYVGLTPKDFDFVVVGATEEEMLQLGFTKVGASFPVFLHPESKHEYALARTERKIGPGYTGFAFDTAKTITLEQDLARRDFTINAMATANFSAISEDIIDPFNGRADMDEGLLRHVSADAFVEDPLRILRAGRFLARYKHMKPVEGLRTLCCQMVKDGALAELPGERIWKEISRGLMEPYPRKMFEFLLDVGALDAIAPELARLKGVPQVAAHHPEVDTFEHIMLCLEVAVKKGVNLQTRTAILLHDLGKGTTKPEILPQHIAHEQRGVALVEAVCERWRIPKKIRELAVLTCKEHTGVHQIFKANKSTVIAFIKRVDGIRQLDRYIDFLKACDCDARGRLGKEDDDYPQHRFLLEVRMAIEKVKEGDIFQANKGLELPKIKLRVQQAEIVAAFPVFEVYRANLLAEKRYPFYPPLCKRYRDLLNAEPKEDPDNPMHEGHLAWMLQELQLRRMEQTKKHRWLGYIQGIMVSKGLISVQEEREATREIFNGQ